MTKAQTTAPKAAKPVEQAKPFYGKLTLLNTANDIGKAITSVIRRVAKLDKDLHVIASSILMHADKHGDITLANKLIDAMPKSARKNAMRDWFIAHGKFAWDEKNKNLAYAKSKSTLYDESQQRPFFAFTAEPEYKPFDMDAAIASLLKRAEKAIENGDAVDTTKLTAIRKLATVEHKH